MSQLYSLPVPDRSQGSAPGLSPARARLAEATIALRDAVEEMGTVARPSNRPFFGQFSAYQRARAAGFPREGRKSQRRRRDKRADRPFAKIKELFTKIKRLT
jgi:hypothetical protein